MQNIAFYSCTNAQRKHFIKLQNSKSFHSGCHRPDVDCGRGGCSGGGYKGGKGGGGKFPWWVKNTKMKHVKSWEECADACQSKANCAAWGYNRETKHCIIEWVKGKAKI